MCVFFRGRHFRKNSEMHYLSTLVGLWSDGWVYLWHFLVKHYVRFAIKSSSNSKWTWKVQVPRLESRKSNAVGSKSIQPSIVITTRRRYLSSPSSFTYEHTLSYSLHLARKKIIIENTKQKKRQKVDFSRFSSKLSSPPKGTIKIRETFQMWRILYFRSGSN